MPAITSAADAPGFMAARYFHAPGYDPGSGVRLSSGERLLKPTNVSGSNPVHVNRINTRSKRVKMTLGKSAGVCSLAVNTDVSISELIALSFPYIRVLCAFGAFVVVCLQPCGFDALKLFVG